ncbi:MAG TPA: 3-hydroxybutyryl-CoA dehydrogenase [Solirubrobacteraceae bacterium]|jgi:3-hydroxybutyryl-CoA dehydrogenase|nr:3-hydroxybutyryl-CoA dehydrogenase [Solirubrobacteraceae bacterium]
MAAQNVSRVGVVGAGFMGSGIAESAASSGIDVTVFEPESAALARSRDRLAASVDRAVSRGKLSVENAERLTGRIAYTTEFDDLGGADAVLEAVTEDPRVKGKLFQRLDEALPEARFLASNTSSIPIAEIASWTRRPERVIGLHFFSPVPVMKLVEVVVGLDTADDTVSVAEAFATGMGKKPIRTKDRSGFIVNMLLVPYLMAAVRMYEDGFASREDIDDGMRLGCGHPMGPLTLCDFIGLDVLYAICDSLYEEFKRPEYAPTPLLKRMVVSGHHGRKTGKGFYDYPS